MIKVLHVVGKMNRGGAESRIMDIFRHIDRTQFDFFFLVYDDDECDYREEILSLGGHFCICPALPRGFIPFFRGIKQIMNKNQFDVIHTHTGTGDGMVLLLAMWFGIPIRIFHARNTFGANQRSLLRYVFESFSLMLIKVCSTVRLCVSNTSADSYFGKDSVKRGYCHLIPNAISIENFSVSENDIDDLRSYFGIKSSNIVIGHVGSFRVEKNHHFLLRLFYELYKLNNEWRLVLVGDGYLRKKIEQEIESLGLNDAVILTGVQTNIQRFYPLFNVFVFPSLSEGLPGSVLEAQACGIPCVISSSIDSIVDVGAGLVTALHLNTPIKEWTESIQLQLSSPSVSQEVILDAFRRSGYTIESEIDLLTKYYRGRL